MRCKRLRHRPYQRTQDQRHKINPANGINPSNRHGCHDRHRCDKERGNKQSPKSELQSKQKCVQSRRHGIQSIAYMTNVRTKYPTSKAYPVNHRPRTRSEKTLPRAFSIPNIENELTTVAMQHAIYAHHPSKFKTGSNSTHSTADSITIILDQPFTMSTSLNNNRVSIPPSDGSPSRRRSRTRRTTPVRRRASSQARQRSRRTSSANQLYRSIIGSQHISRKQTIQLLFLFMAHIAPERPSPESAASIAKIRKPCVTNLELNLNFG